MEAWRRVWQEGAAPLLSTPALEALKHALLIDDPRLIQGATTTPPPLMSVKDWPVEAACLLGFCGWQGDGLETVGEVEEFFAKMCFSIDQAMHEPAACRYLLNHYDETPREQMRQEILHEIKLELARREEAVA